MSPLSDDQQNLINAARERSPVFGSSPFQKDETAIPFADIPLNPLTADTLKAAEIVPKKPQSSAEAIKRAATKALGQEFNKRALRNNDGKLRACLSNAMDLFRLSPDWEGVLAYDEFSRRIVVKKPTPVWKKPVGEEWTDRDTTLATEWLQRSDCMMQSENQVGSAIYAVATESKFHPVRDYLRSLKWDGTERIGFWLRDYFRVEDSTFVQAVSEKWLLSAVARVNTPGAKVDHTLLIEGRQGLGKSSGMRALFGDDWFSENISVLGSKDSRLELRGKWCVEISELSAMNRTEIETVKNFLSTQVDTLRDPYARTVGDVPRQTVFCATTNSFSSLADETGNRRFWPVRCGGPVRVGALKAIRDQLFAEAYFKYKKLESWWIDTAELAALARDEQDSRYQPGQWDDQIDAWIDDPQPATVSDKPFLSKPGQVSLDEILVHCIRKETGHWTIPDTKSVARCLKHLGYERTRVTHGERRVWMYLRDAE